MSSPATDEEIMVSRLIIASLQMDGAPGASVNHTGNPFVYGLIGSFDTLKMADRVIKGLDQHRQIMREQKAQIEAAKPAVV